LTRFDMTADNRFWSHEGGGRSMSTRILVWLSIPAALSLLSCGDADPPPAEGAAAITVKNSGSATTGFACGASHTLVLGTVAPTPAEPGAAWVDGQGGNSVSCTVRGSGTYTFSGEIRGGNLTFRISGTATQGATSTATVGLFDPVLTTAMSDSACTVNVLGNYSVEKGSIWAGVSCSHLVSSEDRYLWCAVDAVFILKNCAD
jgi:hypothetical protein